MCSVTHKDILAGFKTDHSMVMIQIVIHRNQRGPGFWRRKLILYGRGKLIPGLTTPRERKRRN